MATRFCFPTLQTAVFAIVSLFSQVLCASATMDSIAVKSPMNNLVVLPEGALITLQLKDCLSSEEAVIGQVVRFEVDMTVSVDGKTIVAAGTQATGVVTDLDKPGVFGAAGRIEITVNHVLAVDGQRIPVKSARIWRSGKNRKMLAWGGSAVLGGLCLVNPAGAAFLLSGLAIKGKHASFSSGEGVMLNARVSKDVVVKA